MKTIQDSKVVRRLILVIVAIATVPATALVPAFLANHLVESPTNQDNGVIFLESHDVEPRLMRVETVMVNPALSGSLLTQQDWTHSNIIRNGVLIREGLARPGDLIGFPIEDNPMVRQLPTHTEKCSTVVQSLRDETNDLPQGWNLAYLEIIDDSTSKLRRCPLP